MESTTYTAVHARVKRQKGSASTYTCVVCEGPATDWAWIEGCPDTQQGVANPKRKSLSPYCAHIEHYEPRCKKCHMHQDRHLSPNRKTWKWQSIKRPDSYPMVETDYGPMEQLLFSPKTVANLLGISKSFLYQILEEDLIKSVYIGSSRRFTRKAIEEFLDGIGILP